ncbi:MAG TPA: hypothetical protein VNP04_06105 [Alphaproteobacteria bacterium]|nr:hypothetical protein [Alphaproteobacteria bacterium]
MATSTQRFAQNGMMGEHASQPTQDPNPRLGLCHLARELQAMGLIEDDSRAALRAFVAEILARDPDLQEFAAVCQ